MILGRYSEQKVQPSKIEFGKAEKDGGSNLALSQCKNDEATDLTKRRFDRVVFNFPHAGFREREDHPHVVKYVDLL